MILLFHIKLAHSFVLTAHYSKIDSVIDEIWVRKDKSINCEVNDVKVTKNLHKIKWHKEEKHSNEGEGVDKGRDEIDSFRHPSTITLTLLFGRVLLLSSNISDSPFISRVRVYVYM